MVRLNRWAVVVALLVAFGALAPALAQDGVSETYDALRAMEAAFEVNEEVVTFAVEGQTVVGTLATPDGEGPYPVVVMFHGFGSPRDELPIIDTADAMFSRTARTFAEMGVASLRIDFRGSGESDGGFEDTTFSGQITDALAALDFVASLEAVDTERIAVLGISQGGLVAAAVAGRDDRVASAVLWSPVAVPYATYASIFTTEGIQAGLDSGGEIVDITLPWGAVVSLRTGFFEELFTVSPLAEIAAYDGPLMVVVGERDTLVFPQPQAGQSFLDYHEGDERLILLDGDHTFDILGVGPERLDDAIFWSLAWLTDTL